MAWYHNQLEDAARNPFGLLPAESWIKSTEFEMSMSLKRLLEIVWND